MAVHQRKTHAQDGAAASTLPEFRGGVALANAFGPVQDERISIEKVNGPFGFSSWAD